MSNIDKKKVISRSPAVTGGNDGNTREIRPGDALVKAEMLAEECVEDVQRAIREIIAGQHKNCLSILEDIESKMLSTLAFAELYDIEQGYVEVH